MMESLLLEVGLVLISLLILAWGFLSMFSPRTLTRAMAWYARADKWSTRRPNAASSGSLSQRVAGFLGILVGGWMLLIVTHHRLYGHNPSASPPIHPSQSAATSNCWLGWVMGLSFNAYGLYMLFKPELNARMVQDNFPDRELSQDVVKDTKGGRLLGIALILFGACLLFHLYRSAR